MQRSEQPPVEPVRRRWREAGELQLVAEFDIEELERINDSMHALKREFSEAQRALAQAHRAR